MSWSFIFFLNSILLGIGLTMDAFSVSLANGLNEPNMRKRRMSLMAGVYAIFQFAMPMIGWVCVYFIAQEFEVFSKYIVPCVALILLLFIGGKMIIEGVKLCKHPELDLKEEEKLKKLTIGGLLVQGIATSIDALSVGFTIAEYDYVHALVASLIVGTVTFIFCFVGLILGKKFGMKLGHKAEIIGGIILIGIGIEIFVKGVIGWF